VKKRGLIALVLVLAVLMTGFSMDYDDETVRGHVEGAIGGLIAGDFRAFRAHVSEELSGEELNAFFQQLSGPMGEIESYTLTAVNKKVGVRDGVDYIAVLYHMTVEDVVYEVEAVMFAEQSGLAGLHINETDVAPEPEEAPAGVLGWVFTALGIAAVGFTIWMAVDCVRRRVKHRWLWLALIVLVWLMLSFALVEGRLSFRFFAGLNFGLTNLKVYAGGGFEAVFYLPMGAMIYFFQRKKLTRREQEQETLGPELAGPEITD